MAQMRTLSTPSSTRWARRFHPGRWIDSGTTLIFVARAAQDLSSAEVQSLLTPISPTMPPQTSDATTNFGIIVGNAAVRRDGIGDRGDRRRDKPFTGPSTTIAASKNAHGNQTPYAYKAIVCRFID
jgi:hypothetical protein